MLIKYVFCRLQNLPIRERNCLRPLQTESLTHFMFGSVHRYYPAVHISGRFQGITGPEPDALLLFIHRKTYN